MRTARFRATRRMMAIATLAALTAGACTVTEVKESGGTTAPADGTPTTTAAAEDWPDATTQGITDDSVRLGAALISAATLRSQGIDIEMIDPEQLLRGWIQVLNDEGGVAGRQVELRFAPYVPISEAQAQQVCTELVEDEEVFAVLGQFTGDTSLCVAETNALPYIGLYGSSVERQARAKGPFFATEMSDDRQRVAAIEAFAAEGELDGQVIALYSQARDAKIVEDAVKPALEAAGVEIAVETTLDSFGGGAGGGVDQAAQDAAMDTIVEKMRSADVDTVLNVSNFTDPISAFGRKGWSPDKILVTSAQALSEDVIGQTDLDPEVLAKVVVAAPYSPTKEALLADETVTACIDDYNGTDPEEPVDVETATRTELGGLAILCSAFTMFVAGLEGAGEDLTPTSWAEGVSAIGEDPMPGYPFSSLAPGKHDLGDTIGVYTFDPDDGLFVPTGDPIDARD